MGRERELQELLTGLQDAAMGRGGLFLVTGEAGIGKTRLARELGDQAGQLGARSLWGSAWGGGEAPPFWPWIQILRQLASAGNRAASRLAPLLVNANRDEPDDFALFDAAASCLVSAADDRPLVLALDDLHAADRHSILLLDFLAPRLVTTHVIVLALYREGEGPRDRATAQVFSDVARRGRRIPLRGLRPKELADFVGHITGFAPTPALVRAVNDVSDGNPFLADEFVRLLLADGRIGEGQPPNLAEADVPSGVRASVRQRLTALPDEAVATVLAASVLGRAFTVEGLVQLTARPAGDIAEGLAVAATAGIVVRVNASDRYRFAHALIREAVHEELSPRQRLTWHRSAAEALEKLYGEHPDHLGDLAYHFFLGGPPEKAVHYLTLAARQARLGHSYEEAAQLYRDALDVLDREPPDDLRTCSLLLELGSCQWRVGRGEAARATFQHAAGLARRVGSARQLANAALGFGGGRIEPGRVNTELVALLEEAVEALGGDEPVLQARLLGRLAVALYFTGDPPRRSRLSGLAIEKATGSGDPAALAAALGSWHFSEWTPANAEERLGAATQIVELGRQAGDAELVLEGQTWQIVDLLELGRPGTAWQLLADFTAAADQLELPLYRWYALLFQATRTFLEGQLVDAERFAREAWEVGEQAQIASAGQFFWAQLSVIRGEQGRLDEVERTVASLASQYPALPVWRCAHAWIMAELGRLDEARRQLDALAEEGLARLAADGNALGALALAAKVCATLGDAERAATLRQLLEPYAERWATVATAVVCVGPVSHHLGLLAAAAGDSDAAERHFEAALADTSPHAPLWAAHTRRAYGEMLLTSSEGDEGRGQELLQAAATLFHSLGLDHRASAAGGELALASSRAAGEPRRAVLRREGEYWTVGYQGATAHLRDSKGLRLIAHLVRYPGQQFYSGDLAALGSAPDSAGLVKVLGDAGDVIDAQARDAYRQRLKELEGELEEARRFQDLDRAAKLAEEIDFLGRELAAGVGIGGRPRVAASALERARLSVTKAIRTGQRRIAEHHQDLGRHLAATLRTGRFCSYAADAAEPVTWEL